ncbi:OmpH family outer membrane protein [Chryseolinea lacunae]|uniref:OmpH family outer membrane protein n=1 Tax=Chryseolinea lacunae TaxID=2801331 RepID=A0ABS1KXW4_9BACT|nr:OmpH family outer membrane protein [Chryseolinea lacunae]MBL0744296.1 OmpH family outer membrane protein [Chryseolinea lacunae]
MKNLSLILNAVLLVAVGVLFYLHFSAGKPATASSTTAAPGELKIAYINSDSVLKNYEYLKVNRQLLEDKTKKMDQDYRNRAISLQNEIAAYQRNVQSMTLGQVKATEEDLGKKQQNLQLYQQSLGQQLMDEEAKLNKALYERVTVFLKKYGKENGLQVVLKTDVSSDVLYADDALDISKAVTDGLNSDYKTEKADSTAVKK